ncbi:MAG TPA: aminotransferase class IV [Planctomycetota bacterium]|nr:aminotransferase class IV [Planctomycetota bacterium]
MTGATLQFHALTADGPRQLAIEKETGTVHELLDCLPLGVYSALRTFHHERFLWLDAHFDRTERSMAQLGWAKRLPREELRVALHELVRPYPLAEATVRFDVLREPTTIQGVSADTFIALSPDLAVPEKFLMEGVRVELAPHLHREAPRIKTTEFVRRRRPLPLATQERYEGVLLDEEQRILECSSANIAFVRGQEVISAGDGVLEGITSLVLRKLAPTLGLTWVDERVPLAELERVDEAFLSSSSRGVVPIVQIESTRIGSGAVGRRTTALLEAYYAFADSAAS